MLIDSTAIQQGRRRQRQKKFASFQISITKAITMVICFQLRDISTFVNCVGRWILRGWLEAGQGVHPNNKHSFLNPRLLKVTNKILYYAKSVLWAHFKL